MSPNLIQLLMTDRSRCTAPSHVLYTKIVRLAGCQCISWPPSPHVEGRLDLAVSNCSSKFKCCNQEAKVEDMLHAEAPREFFVPTGGTEANDAKNDVVPQIRISGETEPINGVAPSDSDPLIDFEEFLHSEVSKFQTDILQQFRKSLRRVSHTTTYDEPLIRPCTTRSAHFAHLDLARSGMTGISKGHADIAAVSNVESKVGIFSNVESKPDSEEGALKRTRKNTGDSGRTARSRTRTISLASAKPSRSTSEDSTTDSIDNVPTALTVVPDEKTLADYEKRLERMEHETSEAQSRRMSKFVWNKVDASRTRESLFFDYDEDGILRMAESFAASPGLDMVVAFIVFINVLFLVAEAQMEGIEIGNRLFQYSNIVYSETWRDFFGYVDYVFLSIYVTEMVFKVIALRSRFFTSKWNVFDGLTVIAATLSVMLAGVDPAYVNPIFVRLCRLAKLLRLTHVLRTMRFFDSFLVLTKSLTASCGALFWSFFFIFIVIAVSALITNQFVLEHFGLTKHVNDRHQEAVFLAFGTYIRAMVSMFEVTLGNWGPPTWLLMDNVSEVWAAYMLCYKLTAGFAMLNVINAVFLRLTMKEADALDSYAINQAKKDAEKLKKRINKLFDIMDTSGDGLLSYEEFRMICKSSSLRAWMNLMNVSTRDVDELWRAIDDGDGMIERSEFMEGFVKLNGPATAVDALSIKALIRELLAAEEIDTSRPLSTNLSSVPEAQTSDNSLSGRLGHLRVQTHYEDLEV